MSRSNPTLQNPAQHFMQWSGSKGVLEWYHKEKKVNVPVKLPFEFMVLDVLGTITGYDERNQVGYFSNEVRSVAKDELTVRTKKGVQYIGKYKNDQGIPQLPQGARYASSVYIAHLNANGEYIIGNIKMVGAALSAWIEFSQQHIVENGKVRLTGSTDGQKGATTYKIPTFEWDHATSEEDAVAKDLDNQLQTYLNQYMAAAETARSERPDTEVDQTIGYVPEEGQGQYMPDPMDKVHSENPMGPTVDEQATIKTERDALEDLGGEEINLDDIPF